MIASFFQSLEENRVAYLLISGQATVLYGAATFSEDIDLWLNPARENIERFRNALAAAGGRYYKLTPPLEPAFYNAGHGFHFTFGNPPGDEVFLDVMGRPPRTREFAAAFAESRHFPTEWGVLPTVGIPDLVELKKTQRLADYPIISALTLRHLEEQSTATSGADLAWAAANLFTIDSFFAFSESFPQWIGSAPPGTSPSLLAAVGQPLDEIPDEVLSEISQWLAEAVARHQLADRLYWRKIIAELRELRAQGQLMAEGAPVR
jgi:hypothetical protein